MEKLSSLEVDEGLTQSCCWDNWLSPCKHPMPPHLEPFPRLIGLNHHIYQVSSATWMHGYLQQRRRRDESVEAEQAGGRPRHHSFTVLTCYRARHGEHSSED